MSALTWAMFATGKAYLLAFGIFGAGKPIGVYAPNYMPSACRKSEMKRGQVMMNLAMGPVGQTGVLFGWIADSFHKSQWTAFGQDSRALGFKLIFAVCAGVLIPRMLFTLLRIPARLKRNDEQANVAQAG